MFYTISIFVCTTLGLLLLAKRFGKIGVKQKSLTLAHWVGKRYNSDFLRIGVSTLTLFNIAYIAGQFIGIAYILNSLLSVPYNTGVIISAVIIVIYIVVGGAYANVRTDFIQGMVMAVIALVVVIKGYLSFPNGFASIHQGLASQGQNFVSLINPASSVFNTPWALISIVWLLLIFITNPHLLSNILTLRDPKEFEKFIMTASGCLFIYQLVPLTGLYARAKNLIISRPDMVLLEFLRKYL